MVMVKMAGACVTAASSILLDSVESLERITRMPKGTFRITMRRLGTNRRYVAGMGMLCPTK